MRIGHGFDVHRLVAGRKLILGGVEIPFAKGLEGHSDADVLTHAVIDAILGAIGKNDIGTLFPDTDPEYKDISSLVLLEKVVFIAYESGYRLGNLDALLHADQPKVKDHIPEMRRNYSRILNCDESLINVKATTWEGLGFAGTGEGMAASAVCILLPLDNTDIEETNVDEFAGDENPGTESEDQHVLFPDSHEGRIAGQIGRRMKAVKGRIVKSKAFVAHIDGASRGNPGPSAVGVVIRDPEGVILAEISERIEETTNNVAEYKSLIRALEECKLLKAEHVLVLTDSQLLERQITGAFKIKKPHLVELYNQVKKLTADFKAFAIEQIPRDENKEADSLANLALNKK